MKKKKKLISAGLSVLLAILCISGCNSSDTSGTTKANSSRTSDTTKADSSETQNTETTSVPESSTEQSTVIDDILSDFDYCAIDEDCIAITGYRGEGGMVEIPSTIDGMKVTIIGSLQQLVDGVPLDLVNEDLENAYRCLREILGEYNKEDLLDQIFSRFCVGK